MKHERLTKLSSPAVRAMLATAVAQAITQTAVADFTPDRSVLPIAPPKVPLYSELDVRNATAPPRFEVTAPEDAPNVIVVLIDDLGFAGTSTFGGPVDTPTFDTLASEGVRYNNFHTTAVSSPTRAAIKSGRNHHAVSYTHLTLPTITE